MSTHTNYYLKYQILLFINDVQWLYMKSKKALLSVIAGPMFSGKTEELIRQVRRAVIAKKKVQVFKHKIDTRYGTDAKLFSHNGLSLESDIINSASEILKNLDKRTEIVAIDEAQWFGPELIAVINKLLAKKKQVIVSGLAMTYERVPFAPIPELMAMADRVTKLSAVCVICGEEAVFHKRKTKTKPIDPSLADPALVGKIESYEARCRKCFNKL